MTAGCRVGFLSMLFLSHRPLTVPRFIWMNSRAFTRSERTVMLNDDDIEFLPWLRRKSGREISSTLSIGRSTYGRSLFSSRFIHAGERLLSVPYNVQLTPDSNPSLLKPLITDDVSDIGRLAVIVLAEGGTQGSDWVPYVSRLPRFDDMHCLIFWSDSELEMIRPSLVCDEALHQRNCIEKEFSAVKLYSTRRRGVCSIPGIEEAQAPHSYTPVTIDVYPCVIISMTPGDTIRVLESYSENLGHVSLKSFMHAYALDFLNHDGNSENMLMSDEDNETSEVIAGRDYAAGEEVLIRYGKFSNGTLLLDFGFTLRENACDQVDILMDVPMHDPLYNTKVELLKRHCVQTKGKSSTVYSSVRHFTIKEVRSIHGNGKGIPMSLRAFARVLSAKSLDDLEEMCAEARENDGRLARRPLRVEREIDAHLILLSKISLMIESYNASLEWIEYLSDTRVGGQRPCRIDMARDLLAGELRVLKSVCCWLENYCSALKEVNSCSYVP